MNKKKRSAEDKKFPLPVYKKEDDIYRKEKEVPLEEENDRGKKIAANKGGYQDDDLDVPGAEFDDADEAIGEEDEENNYYSLGGDEHDDLEEDNNG